MDICLKQQQNINNSQFRGANIKKGKKKEKEKEHIPFISLYKACTIAQWIA
jgi:hypothetical protein